MKTWVLDARLESSSFYMADELLCQIRLKNNALYPWIILIPRVPDITELHDLSASDQIQLIKEITAVSSRMKHYLKADKMNCAALGNMVPQLHIHLIARYHTDPMWPHSIFQKNLEEKPYTTAQAKEVIERFSVIG